MRKENHSDPLCASQTTLARTQTCRLNRDQPPQVRSPDLRSRGCGSEVFPAGGDAPPIRTREYHETITSARFNTGPEARSRTRFLIAEGHADSAQVMRAAVGTREGTCWAPAAAAVQWN